MESVGREHAGEGRPFFLMTGAEGALGRRVAPVLAGLGSVLERGRAGTGLPAADVLVHLAAGSHDALAEQRSSPTAATVEVLGDPSMGGVRHVVLVSSAMVYGAWPNNPVPLTEESPLRADSTFAFAHQLGQVEQMVDAWRRTEPGRTVTVLRPVLTMSADDTSSVVRALAAGIGSRLDEDDPPAQFLHLDDLASAVILAATRRLDGVYNVAPDGWIAGETVRALAGRPPRIKMPSLLLDPVVDLRWRFQRGPIPPGLWRFAQHPWLVANDRLKAEGWRPQVTNEQAYVEGTESRWWTMLTPQRKQELALGAMATAALGGVGAVAAVVRRARR